VKGDFKSAIDITERLKAYSLQILASVQGRTAESNQLIQRLGDIESMICDYKIAAAEKEGGSEAAINTAIELYKQFESSNSQYKTYVLGFLGSELKQRVGDDNQIMSLLNK